MTDKTERDIFRGEQAARLLSDELLLDAFATIEREYTDQWLQSPARDTDGRERLFLMVKTLHRLKLELQCVLETGQTAKMSLAQRIGQRLSPFS